MGEAGTILRTTDGSVTWKRQSSGASEWLTAVHFSDLNTGTVVGMNGTVLRTTDGGATWKRQSSATDVYLTGVWFTDANTGTVVGFRGTILHTVDGGATWTAQVSGTRTVCWEFPPRTVKRAGRWGVSARFCGRRTEA